MRARANSNTLGLIIDFVFNFLEFVLNRHFVVAYLHHHQLQSFDYETTRHNLHPPKISEFRGQTLSFRFWSYQN